MYATYFTLVVVLLILVLVVDVITLIHVLIVNIECFSCHFFARNAINNFSMPENINTSLI